MDNLYCGAARQQHFYQAVAKFQRGLAQDLRDLREEFASRGVSGMGWHPRIKEAMERLRTVGDEMLAFDADYAELLSEQWKAAGTTPDANPFGEDRAALVVDYASGAASGLATSISRDGKLDSANSEHVLTVAREVAAVEAYRLRRDYARRRELFAIQTSGHRPVDAPLPAGDDSERGRTPLERSAVDRLISLFERYRCEYPHLRYARIPLRDGNLPPELSCNGRDGSAVGSVVDAIGQSVRDAATAIFNNQLDVDGQPTMHLVLNDSDSLDGWQRFTALAEEALRFPWQATVDGVVLPKRTHVHPGLDWLSIVCAVAAGDKTHTQLLRQTWLQWRDRDGVLRSCCLLSGTGAIESNLAGLGLSGDVEYQIEYEELQNIFDVSAEVLSLFVNHSAGSPTNIADEVPVEATLQDPMPTSDVPKTYLFGWPSILEALNLGNDDEHRRRVARLSETRDGPIIGGGQGNQPKAEKGKLLAWWNGLELVWQDELNQKAGGRLEAEATHDYGAAGTVSPEIGGKVKSRRSDRGTKRRKT